MFVGAKAVSSQQYRTLLHTLFATFLQPINVVVEQHVFQRLVFYFSFAVGT
jgi:hypothetical protein